MSETKKVFISYAREDKSLARRLFRDLQAAGAEPWLDEESILPGQRWKVAISSAIRESDFFLALLSSSSVSKRGYVQKELREAMELLDQTPEDVIYVIPARLDECRPSHEKLLDLSWVDLFPEYEIGLRKLLLVIRPRLEASSGRLRSAEIGDREDLKETGWGVVFTKDTSEDSKNALRSLLEHRRAQAGPRFRELSIGSGESKDKFLAKYGSGPGPVDPERVPYYLLLVGSPEEIPFSVQYQLGIQHRVGRLDFDRAEDFQNYATSAIEAESLSVRRVGNFFGVSHPDDRASNLAITRLVEPLADYVSQSFTDWDVRLIKNESATKRRLVSEFEEAQGVALWFIVSHGLRVSPGSAGQRQGQGAIVCADWRHSGKPLDQGHLFSGEDIPQDVDLRGGTFFYFGSFSAGTSVLDDFTRSSGRLGQPHVLTPTGFTSGLAKSLLGRKNGALGFIGHVNDIWLTSFQWRGAGPQTQTFEAAFRNLVEAKRLGASLAPFSQRYAELSADLSALMLNQSLIDPPDRGDLEMLQTAAIDARNYILLGDPAARSSLEDNRSFE